MAVSRLAATWGLALTASDAIAITTINAALLNIKCLLTLPDH
ncbi:MAG: hypothetical protein ACLFV6_17685 [Spirulinaceae cyanobacterium]